MPLTALCVPIAKVIKSNISYEATAVLLLTTLPNHLTTSSASTYPLLAPDRGKWCIMNFNKSAIAKFNKTKTNIIKKVRE